MSVFTLRSHGSAVAAAATVFAVAFGLGATIWGTPATALPGALVVLSADGEARAPIAIEGLYPGADPEVVRYVLGVDRLGPAARLGFELSALEDFEDGCSRPEVNTGDASCDDGDPTHGELSDQLTIAIRMGPIGTATTCPSVLTAPTEVVPPMLLADLATAGPIALGMDALAPGETRCVEFVHALPRAADNTVQTDRSSFTVTFGAEQQVGPAPRVPGRLGGR